LTHRHSGSIGQKEFPGKVWKGKKMPGRLGGYNATILNQKVMKIDTDRALLYIKGNTPGAINAVVKVRDAVKKADRQCYDLLYPTFIASAVKDPKEAAKV
jgi:large subunit ribosomal protein L3